MAKKPYWAVDPITRWDKRDGSGFGCWDKRGVFKKNGKWGGPPAPGNQCYWSVDWILQDYQAPAIEQMSNDQVRIEFSDYVARGVVPMGEAVILASMMGNEWPHGIRERAERMIREKRIARPQFIAPWTLYKRWDQWHDVPLMQQKLYSPQMRKNWDVYDLKELLDINPSRLGAVKRGAGSERDRELLKKFQRVTGLEL